MAIQRLTLDTGIDAASRRINDLLLSGENRVLSMLTQQEPLAEVLEQICLLMEAVVPGCLVSILVLDPRTNRLTLGAAPSFPATYTEYLRVNDIHTLGGPCSSAVLRKVPVIVDDIARLDSSGQIVSQEYCDLALAHDLCACWSTPLLSATNDVLGTFGVSFRTLPGPVSQYLDLLDQVTHLTKVVLERSFIEARLRLNEACLSEAQKLSQTGSFWWDPASGVVTWSEQAFRIYEFDSGMTPSLDLARQRLHPDDRLLFETTSAKAVGMHEDFVLEHRLLMPDGRIKHVRVVSRALQNKAADAIEYLGAVMDVSAEKRSQHALESALRDTQKLKEQFRLALDTIPGLVWIALPDGHIDFLNQRWLDFTGLTLEEASGWGWAVAIHPEDVEELDRYWRTLLATKQPGETEARLRHFDGSYRWFIFRAVPFFDDRGKLLHWYGQTTDIHDRKSAEDALRGSEQFARGQVAALTSTLNALAKESALDKLMEHVLRTITLQLEAHSNSVWLRQEQSGLVGFEYAFENSRLVTRNESELAQVSASSAVENLWPWSVVFSTGKPFVLEDIRENAGFPWREHLVAMGIITILIVPMMMADCVEGVIGIRFSERRSFRPDELELAQALTNQAMLAMQLTTLSVKSREVAIMEERNRMARDIHDTLAQGFTGVIVQMEAATDAISRELISEAGEHINRAGTLARESLSEARRSVRALRPQILEDRTLCEALAELMAKMTAGSSMQADFVLSGQPRTLPHDLDKHVLHIGQEVLTNAIRHSRASHFVTRITFLTDTLELLFHDDGAGFDPHSVRDGFGLIGIRERVSAMDGRLNIDSSIGKGTTIAITLSAKNLFTQ